ncbi:MAG: hypothetical protein K2L07_01570, partial [Lachnospiraceae bacterium]|nr:hypothetical protein [Lachnospiraceae bacterium]
EFDYKIEDELDSQMRKEKREKQAEGELSKEESFDLRLEQESQDVEDAFDLHFSEEQMEELDALENLADLDIGDLDFADLDFDDVDVTKLEGLDDGNFDELLKDFEGDLEIDDFFESSDQKKESLGEEEPEQDLGAKLQSDNSEAMQNEDLNEDTFDANEFLDSLLNDADENEANEDPIKDMDEEETSLSGELKDLEDHSDGLSNEEGLDGDALETLLTSEDETEYGDTDSLEGVMDSNDLQMMDENEELSNGALGDETADASLSGDEVDDLDDILSMLDLDESDGQESAPAQEKAVSDGEENEDTAVLSDDVEMLEEQPGKKKRTFMQILFGDPDDDEDELSVEELEEIEAKKAAKKAAKAEKKEAAKAAKKEKEEKNKAQKALEDEKKRRAEEQKNQLRAEKKAKRKAEEEAEAAKEGPEKKLNKPMVVFVFTLFLGGLLVFCVGTNNFNYTQVIERATNYFANQKYRPAYDEIVGVEVKEDDEDLKDRIYTVMYVERLYEAYNNNVAMGNEEKALDSLLHGVEKYYEYYEEAQELGIVSDIDYSFSQIKEVLQSRYGISIEQALDINAMENLQYVKTIDTYVENVVNANEGVQAPKEDISGTDEEENDSTQPDADLSSEEEKTE